MRAIESAPLSISGNLCRALSALDSLNKDFDLNAGRESQPI